VVKILFNIIKVNLKERLLTDSCLEKRYHNSLFRKTCDSYIVGVNDIKVSTLENTTSQAKEVDNKIKMLILRSP
jgi:hypothetical protein